MMDNTRLLKEAKDWYAMKLYSMPYNDLSPEDKGVVNYKCSVVEMYLESLDKK